MIIITALTFFTIWYYMLLKFIFLTCAYFTAHPNVCLITLLLYICTCFYTTSLLYLIVFPIKLFKDFSIYIQLFKCYSSPFQGTLTKYEVIINWLHGLWIHYPINNSRLFVRIFIFMIMFILVTVKNVATNIADLIQGLTYLKSSITPFYTFIFKHNSLVFIFSLSFLILTSAIPCLFIFSIFICIVHTLHLFSLGLFTKKDHKKYNKASEERRRFLGRYGFDETVPCTSMCQFDWLVIGFIIVISIYINIFGLLYFFDNYLQGCTFIPSIPSGFSLFSEYSIIPVVIIHLLLIILVFNLIQDKVLNYMISVWDHFIQFHPKFHRYSAPLFFFNIWRYLNSNYSVLPIITNFYYTLGVIIYGNHFTQLFLSVLSPSGKGAPHSGAIKDSFYGFNSHICRYPLSGNLSGRRGYSTYTKYWGLKDLITMINIICLNNLHVQNNAIPALNTLVASYNFIKEKIPDSPVIKHLSNILNNDKLGVINLENLYKEFKTLTSSEIRSMSLNTAGVYILTHIKDKSFYIGSAIDIKTRIQSHYKDILNRKGPKGIISKYPEVKPEDFTISILAMTASPINSFSTLYPNYIINKGEHMLIQSFTQFIARTFEGHFVNVQKSDLNIIKMVAYQSYSVTIIDLTDYDTGQNVNVQLFNMDFISIGLFQSLAAASSFTGISTATLRRYFGRTTLIYSTKLDMQIIVLKDGQTFDSSLNRQTILGRVNSNAETSKARLAASNVKVNPLVLKYPLTSLEPGYLWVFDVKKNLHSGPFTTITELKSFFNTTSSAIKVSSSNINTPVSINDVKYYIAKNPNSELKRAIVWGELRPSNVWVDSSIPTIVNNVPIFYPIVDFDTPGYYPSGIYNPNMPKNSLITLYKPITSLHGKVYWIFSPDKISWKGPYTSFAAIFMELSPAKFSGSTGKIVGGAVKHQMVFCNTESLIVFEKGLYYVVCNPIDPVSRIKPTSLEFKSPWKDES